VPVIFELLKNLAKKDMLDDLFKEAVQKKEDKIKAEQKKSTA